MGPGGLGQWAVEFVKALYGESVLVCAADVFVSTSAMLHGETIGISTTIANCSHSNLLQCQLGRSVDVLYCINICNYIHLLQRSIVMFALCTSSGFSGYQFWKNDNWLLFHQFYVGIQFPSQYDSGY